MDITPVIPKGHNVIKGYGDMAFKINEDEYTSSIVVSPEKVISWDVNAPEDISVDSLVDMFNPDELEILLVGCGIAHAHINNNIFVEFEKLDVGIEVMTTGAACRTYNVLLAEGRKVAAALILV